eukprot:362018-Chlamydomonas_euryale.AAC.1
MRPGLCLCAASAASAPSAVHTMTRACPQYRMPAHCLRPLRRRPVPNPGDIRSGCIHRVFDVHHHDRRGSSVRRWH